MMWPMFCANRDCLEAPMPTVGFCSAWCQEEEAATRAVVADLRARNGGHDWITGGAREHFGFNDVPREQARLWAKWTS